MSHIINEAVPKVGETNGTWVLDDDGVFSVKRLKDLVDKKILGDQGSFLETSWNKMTPTKVNIFYIATLQKKVPVRFVLDQVGLDLDTLLCPCCNDVIESIDHCFIRCKWVMNGWNRISQWWDVDNVSWGSVDEALTYEGRNIMKSFMASRCSGNSVFHMDHS